MKTYESLELSIPNRSIWSVSALLDLQARTRPDKPFVVWEGVENTYAEVDEAANHIGSWLRGMGLADGDRVMLFLDNCVEYVLGWFGASRAGLVEVPTNSDYLGRFLTHAVTLTTPKAIVVHSHYVDRFVDVRDDLADLEPVFFVVGDDPDPGVAALEAAGWKAMPFASLLAAPESPVEHVIRPPRKELGALLFTSGTTGPSKAVMMSHAHLFFFANEYISMMRLTADDVLMTDGPMFHGNAQFFSILPTLITGATSYVYRKFSPSSFAERVAESGATVTNWVGVMMDWVAKQPESELESQSRLRSVFACPTAFTSVDDLRQRYGIESFNELFGQTETGAAILTPYGSEDRPPGAAGLHASEWFEVRLVDPETDEDVPVGEVGELVVRPKEPWVINLGYFGMPEASLEARRNLWFHTGDGMRRDEDGWFYFVDRLGDCLRRRGENISSFEVEVPLREHPDVTEVAAVAAPADEEAGEDELHVFVVAKEGSGLAASSVFAWAESVLPRFLVPRYVTLIDAMPVTPSGKVQKVELRKRGIGLATDRTEIRNPTPA